MLEDFPEKRHNTLKINAIERGLSEWHSKGQEFDFQYLSIPFSKALDTRQIQQLVEQD